MMQQGKVSLLGAMAIGIGGMVGGGIFAVLGEAAQLGQGATPLAFLFAGIIALLTAHAYAHLSKTYPSQGGTVIFFAKAYGFGLFPRSVSCLLWLCYLVTIALYASAFGVYGLTFFPADMQSDSLRHVLISAGIIFPMLVNLISASFVSRSESVVVIIKLVLLAVVIVAGFPAIEYERLAVSHWPPLSGIVVAGMVIFVAYEGFELIANSAEDIQDPAKNLPRAFYGSVIFVVVLYIAVAFVTIGSLSPSAIISASDYALAEAAKPSMGEWGFRVIALSALLATFSAINATIYGNGRLGYVLATEGELPHILERERKDEPMLSIVVVSLIALFLANAIDLSAIAIIGSAGFLLVFAIVNHCAWKLSKECGAKASISAIACFLSTAALIVLLWYTAQTDLKALGVFLAFIVVSVVFEAVYPRMKNRPFLSHLRRR